MRRWLFGVDFCVWYDTRYRLPVDAQRQGRFDALVRDLAGRPLASATAAVASRQVSLNGAPYRWEPDEMVLWLRPRAEDTAAIAAARDAAHFTTLG